MKKARYVLFFRISWKPRNTKAFRIVHSVRSQAYSQKFFAVISINFRFSAHKLQCRVHPSWFVWDFRNPSQFQYLGCLENESSRVWKSNSNCSLFRLPHSEVFEFVMQSIWNWFGFVERFRNFQAKATQIDVAQTPFVLRASQEKTKTEEKMEKIVEKIAETQEKPGRMKKEEKNEKRKCGGIFFFFLRISKPYFLALGWHTVSLLSSIHTSNFKSDLCTASETVF